jgi:ABC-type dipeptide/oligopeptide/nickel transport system permease component
VILLPILARLARAATVLLVVAALAWAFTLAALNPLAALGPGASDAQRAAAATLFGLDLPLHEQFLTFLMHAAQGDFGVSTRLAQPVGPLLAERLPATIALAGLALAISLAIGIGGGVLAAIRPRARSTWVLLVASQVGLALPVFLAGTLVLLVAATVGVLPATGGLALLLPAVTLAIFPSSHLLRLVRTAMTDAMASDHVRFARARGLSNGVALRHALANALVPVARAMPAHVATLVSLCVVTESVFRWPGLGQLLVQSVEAADVPAIAAYVVLLAALFVAVDLATALLCVALDPRLWPAPRERAKAPA